MMKKYLLGVFLFSTLTNQMLPKPELPTLQTNDVKAEDLQDRFKEEAPHVFFDIHGVLATKSLPSIIRGGLGNFGSTCPGMEKLWLAGEFVGVLCTPSFYRNLYGLLTGPAGKNKITESYLHMIGQLGYKRLERELIQFANNIFVENTQMAELIARLKKRGCKVHLFSNMGTDTLQDARKRNLFPNVLEQFDNEPNTINSFSQTTYNIWKPQGHAYELALETTGCKPEQAIMIDDKPENLPTQTGIALALAKANKKKRTYTQPQPWAAGVLYSTKKHQAAVAAFERLGLITKD